MILADPLNPAAYTDRPECPRRRWQLWRSPDGQPAWARPVLLGIAAVAAALYAWNITRAGLAPFYSVAVKSMSVSWKAFFYGAFDPKATITIDKLAGSFLPQALSARIFGFSAWSLALPQVIEGVISVLVMYRVVRRWAGVVPGLLAAAIFALTPITASMFGHSMEDGALTMCLVLAADAYQRAVGEARLRSLIWTGVWVGLGFQAKMLQAWIVLPALALGYLVAASARLRRRLWQLGVAGVAMLAVSMSWIALYTFTPASDRPYIDGSTGNSAVAMVFGYNGLERFGIKVKGAITSGPGVMGGFPARGEFPARGFGARLTSAGNFGTGWTKLFGNEYGPEIGWLYPLAVLALVFGLTWTRRARRTDQVRAGFIMWGTWLVTFGVVFSAMKTIPHTAYMSSLAPPLAALSAAGIVMFWRAYLASGWRGWVPPTAVAAQLAWTLFLWRDYGGFLPWARDAMIAVGGAAVVIMVAARLSQRTRVRLATVGLVADVAAMLAAPGTWAASVLDTKYGGSSLNASAGPAGGGFGGRGGFGGSRFGGRGGFGGGMLSGQTTLTSAENRIYDYVSAHRDGADYLMAVGSWTEASPYIVTTGQEVLAMGGFSGSVPQPTLATVKHLVHSGQLRFFLISGESGLGAARGGRGSASATIDSWVQDACAKVPAADYRATAPTASGSGAEGFGWFGGTQTLYECGQA
jgi:4-amino-4-deoxy-L-arabinose transferase-like glycosyltransferase